MASFVTSYARRVTITAFQRLKDDYLAGKSEIQPIYADTDSLHCSSPGFKLPSGLEIDPYKLGAWKYESRFSDKGQSEGCGAKFLRQKCYIELSADGELNTTIAGLPKKLAHIINFDNFKFN
mgnify:CR=1 FL=1